MKKIRQLLLASLFLLPMLMSAQEMIKGNVKDDQGIDLPGVSIIIKGTTQELQLTSMVILYSKLMSMQF